MDIQECDKHLIYSVLISRHWTEISKIFILTYTYIWDGKDDCLDIAAQCLDIKTEYIRCLSYSWISIFHTCRMWWPKDSEK